MYEGQGLDPMTDGKAWQWGLAAVLVLPLLILVIPLAVAGKIVGRRRQQMGAGRRPART